MKRKCAILCFFVSSVWAASLWAQESQLGAEFRREKEDFQNDCSGSFLKAVAGCGQLLFTGEPLHIAAGSIAPQNGLGLGLAFVSHYTPNERWRLSWNVDAVGSTNSSWRAGAYLKAIYIKPENIVVTTTPPGEKPKPSTLTVREYPVINAYAQSISLNTVHYYGLGNSTSRDGKSVFGMQQTIVGANAILPVFAKLKVSLFGEINGRFVNIGTRHGQSTPSIDQLYTPARAPGLESQPAFLQLAQGVRIRPTFFSNHLQLNYILSFQEFIAPGSRFSFNRFNVDLSHDFPLYGNLFAFRPRDFNGPDDCAAEPGGHRCPAVTRNRSGSFGLRFMYTGSFVSADHVVPFYFQPTLGGSDINGAQVLSSYNDYRFRAPNLILFRGSFEHSIWGPLGFQFMADYGKVALTRSDIDFTHFKHSFATGLTLRAGGFPQVSFLFAWGGQEGTHNILHMNSSLLGGGSRPSLF